MTETLTQRLQRAVALRDAATEGHWVEDDGHIQSKPLSEQAHDYVMRLLSDPEFHAMETDDQINRPVTEVATCSQDLPNFEADAAFIAAAPSIVQLAVELGAEVERMRKALSEQARLALAIRGACIRSQQAPNVFEAIGDWSRDIIKAAEDAINPPATDCGDAQ